MRLSQTRWLARSALLHLWPQFSAVSTQAFAPVLGQHCPALTSTASENAASYSKAEDGFWPSTRRLEHLQPDWNRGHARVCVPKQPLGMIHRPPVLAPPEVCMLRHRGKAYSQDLRLE